MGKKGIAVEKNADFIGSHGTMFFTDGATSGWQGWH